MLKNERQKKKKGQRERMREGCWVGGRKEARKSGEEREEKRKEGNERKKRERKR